MINSNKAKKLIVILYIYKTINFITLSFFEYKLKVCNYFFYFIYKQKKVYILKNIYIVRKKYIPKSIYIRQSK